MCRRERAARVAKLSENSCLLRYLVPILLRKKPVNMKLHLQNGQTLASRADSPDLFFITNMVFPKSINIKWSAEMSSPWRTSSAIWSYSSNLALQLATYYEVHAQGFKVSNQISRVLGEQRESRSIWRAAHSQAVSLNNLEHISEIIKACPFLAVLFHAPSSGCFFPADLGK